eukprot:791341-Rhodomonas_salina.3
MPLRVAGMHTRLCAQLRCEPEDPVSRRVEPALHTPDPLVGNRKGGLPYVLCALCGGCDVLEELCLRELMQRGHADEAVGLVSHPGTAMPRIRGQYTTDPTATR